MLYSTPGWLHAGQMQRLRVQKHRWWRPLLWAGLLVVALLLAWQVTTSGVLLAADVAADVVADTVAINAPWRFVDESKPGAPTTQGELTVANNAPMPVAARFTISSTMQALALQLNEGDLGGVPLAQVDELGYCTRLVDGPRPYAVTLQINIDADVTDEDQSWQGRLVYTPAYNGAVIQGEWQCWNTLVGKWWATGGPVAQHAPADSPQPLGTLLARFPNLGINATYSVVALKAGDGWRDFLGEASPVAIGVEGERYDVAFGTAPQDNEILLPVVFNEPQVVAQNDDDDDDERDDERDEEAQKNKDKSKDKAKQDNEDKKEEDKKQEDNEEEDKKQEDKDNIKEDDEKDKDDKSNKDDEKNSEGWRDIDWSDVDLADFDWESLDWEQVDWDQIEWQHLGWRSETIRAFAEDAKACKKQGWQEQGFDNQGQCVAYYVSAHSPAYLNWNGGWGRNRDDDDNRNGRGQDDDRDDKDRDDDD